jgi:hypothetical protein
LTNERIKDWYLSLPYETKVTIDDKVEEIRKVDGQVVELEGTLTKMVRDLAREIEKLVSDPSQISAIIKHLLEGKVSERTIESALPEENKRGHKPYERYHDVNPQTAISNKETKVLADGRTHMDGDPKELDDEFGMGVVPMTREETGKVEEPKQGYKPYRIVMSAFAYRNLGEGMLETLKKNGDNTDYVIEHDAQTRDFFTDIAEKGERRNVGKQ